MLVFLYVNLTLKYDKNKINELKNYSKLENYSPYIKNYTENANNLNN